VTDLNLEYYVVNVEINFKNKDVNFKEVRIVEYIPKDFASDANKITSDRNYTVLRYDPVIVFENIRAGEGKLLTLVYSLNQKYTKDQVDAMIANNTIDKFPAPPLVFNKETKLAPENFAGNIFAAIALPDLGALFGGGQAAGQASSQGIDIVVIVVIVFAVLMAVIIILLFMLIMTMRGNHRGSSGFSGKRKLL
jgi:hypothetical protein